MLIEKFDLIGGKGVVERFTTMAFFSPLGVTALIMVVALWALGACVGPTELILSGRMEISSGEVEIIVTDLT